MVYSTAHLRQTGILSPPRDGLVVATPKGSFVYVLWSNRDREAVPVSPFALKKKRAADAASRAAAETEGPEAVRRYLEAQGADAAELGRELRRILGGVRSNPGKGQGWQYLKDAIANYMATHDLSLRGIQISPARLSDDLFGNERTAMHDKVVTRAMEELEADGDLRRVHGSGVQAFYVLADSTRARHRRRRSWDKNPRPRRRNSAVRMPLEATGNPQHLPRTTAGRKGIVRWWKITAKDAKDRVLKTSYVKHTGVQARDAARDLVRGKVRGKAVAKVLLDGPYPRKPRAA